MENLVYSTPNILVVDDVNANLVVLTEMIRNSGYIARPVTSAKQATNAIDALTPHLILLDISMPDMDGFEFCEILKKNAKTRDIPIIFISALNSTEDKIRGFQLGAVDYISKPFEIEEVTLRINTHLKIYKMQQELEIYNKKLYKIINDQIRKIYEGQKNVLYALAKLSGARDNSNGDHLKCVGRNSKLLAMSMQLSPVYMNEITNSFIDTIELAAPLHDIGKIAIEDAILKKETALTTQEEEIMKSHAQTGAATLEEIYAYNEQNDFIKMAIDIARYHHENWDGSGFPLGLCGNDIPICARIVAIANDFDLLMNENSEECIQIISEDAGIRYDPNIVHILTKIQNQLIS